ncbi:hypothetical protein Tco_1031610 [Tanacetum coccineum]|uniref:DUF4218 domain-containing protein n=1 Tax=Tanacetum coccineum TaxID=301880 RepID=A0ABQ5G9Q0_9ASTR
MSDMIALLNDLSYIPPNNEQNEPTQGDIGETSNEPTQAKRNEFEELYASANEELYPGCDYVTRLDFMAKFTYFKVKGKLTDSIFNEMLEFFQHVFPTMKGYKLPPSYYAIKKTFKMIGLGLQRLYKSSHTAKEMTWHAIGKCTEPGKMQHPVDGRAWKNFDTKYPNFVKEPRNVRLGLAADGFNSFGNLSQAYSIWPALKGVETIDVATGQKFNMRAMVLWTINDFLARSSLSGWSGQGYRACPTCNEDTHQLCAQVARFPTRVKGKHPSYRGVKIKRNVHVELNWTKRSIFYELKYWSFLTLKHNLDIMHIEKNVLEAILNTLLMKDKSKDTAKARQDLKRLGIRSGLWLSQTKKGKCSKPQAVYSFTPENKKKFCQFIKGVKLPDGFRSIFNHKVADNDTNIMVLKSHNFHIMMQRLLPYGLQQYLPDEIKVVDIMCNLELIYPPAFFDIMIHLVIHLPLEALEGGPIHPRWMFPFERFMKNLKGYVRNKAKPKGSIMEGYVAKEALTFSSHYFWDVTMKFNRPDRNVDLPPPTPEIDTYRSQFKSKFPNKDMKEEFPNWFGSQIYQRHIDNNPGVSATSELFALACGPTTTPISVNSCIVNGVRFVMHNRDERRTTQNSGICSPCGNDGEMYYVTWIMRPALPPDIIDLDEDDDIIDYEDALPHDLADSDDEDLINVDDDDGVEVMSADVTRGHGGNGGGDDHPPTHHIPTGCGGLYHSLDFASKGNRKTNLGGRKAGRLHTRQETRNLRLKNIIDDKGPVPIRFEWDDKKTLMPLGEHASHWSNYLRELIREMPLYYPSWQKAAAKRKAAIMIKIGMQFDLKPHMQSQRWTYINEGIQQHLQKLLPFGMIPGTKPKPSKSPKPGKEHGRMPAGIPMESSATREYPSLIHTFFLTHTINEEEMLRLQALGSNTETGVPYTKEEIMAIVQKGKQRGHLPGVGRVKMMMRLFRSDDKFSQMLDQFESSPEFGGASGVESAWMMSQATMRTATRMRRMAIVRDVIYMDNARKSSTVALNSLPETMRAPPNGSGKSPEKVSLASFPLQLIPGDMSPGIGIPSDKSPRKAWNCRWG